MATSPATGLSASHKAGTTRLTNRGRLLLGASALVVALSLFSANTALGSNDEMAKSASLSVGVGVGYESITVLPGESLWSIARQIAPAFSASTGDIVALIIDINNLTSSELESGQELLVPAI